MSEQNKALIRRLREEILSSHDLSKLEGLYADDYVYHGPPMIGDVKGRDAFRQLASGFVGGIPDLRERVVDQIGEGDRVATRLAGSGTHRGTLMGVPGTGKPMTWTATVVSRFAHGKIAEEWVEFDLLSFLQQLGATVQMPAKP